MNVIGNTYAQIEMDLTAELQGSLVNILVHLVYRRSWTFQGVGGCRLPQAPPHSRLSSIIISNNNTMSNLLGFLNYQWRDMGGGAFIKKALTLVSYLIDKLVGRRSYFL